MKRECEAFKKMMREANPSKAENDWKPPEGYKSAFGKFRDAAKAAADKKKAKPKVAALSDGEDTASDDDYGSDPEIVDYNDDYDLGEYD